VVIRAEASCSAETDRQTDTTTELDPHFFDRPKTLRLTTEGTYAFHIHLMTTADSFNLTLSASINRPLEVCDGVLQN